MELFLSRLAERLKRDGQNLDGILFSGDAQERNAPGGHERVLELLLRHMDPFGIDPSRIVAVPGNHDVPKGSPPSSDERYKDFVQTWRDAGCVVPWLDGLDNSPPINSGEQHRLVAVDRSWAVFPINTSNWSHVTSVLPEPLSKLWEAIPERIAGGDPELAKKLKSQLQDLISFDMARLSGEQLEALRNIVASTPQPTHGRQIRIAVMHHHLRPPSLREEVRPFADISNLEQLRALLSDSNIGVLVHGHKHEHATYFDHIYNSEGRDMHRMLVVSGATFGPGNETEAARLITIAGMPHTPEVTIEPIPLPRPG
jgi:3',5'-cyclic AMP phosphodiesterase CpdA